MNHLYDLLTDERPSRRMYGVAVGTVRELRDPLGLGRVRVTFPWVAADDEDAVVIDENDRRAHSYWARVATLMAGGGRGAYFVPDVGEEVLVAFEHGELDRPVIIGGLWNKDAKPPVEMDEGGQNHIRGIYTRSKHKIELNDSSDKSSILIQDSTGNNRILIDTVNNKMEITVRDDIVISAGGNITITAGGKLKLEGKLAPVGRRGGVGTLMWSREALDIFLHGGSVPPERPGAPPSGGLREPNCEELAMDLPMEELDRRDAKQAGRVAQKGGRVSGPRAGEGFAHGQAQGSEAGAARPRRAGSLRAPARGAAQDSGRDAGERAMQAALLRLRRLTRGAKSEDG